MKNDNELMLILIALMTTQAKFNYDSGLVSNSNIRYSGDYLGDIPKISRYVQDNSVNIGKYPLGAETKRGGFRR